MESFSGLTGRKPAYDSVKFYRREKYHQNHFISTGNFMPCISYGLLPRIQERECGLRGGVKDSLKHEIL
jgi:hypothetical protein